MAIKKNTIGRTIAASAVDSKVGRWYGPFTKHRAFISALHREASKLKNKK